MAGHQGCVALGLILATSVAYATDRYTGTSAYRWTVACQLVWPVCLAIGIYFSPESPRHLVNRGRNEDAYRSLVCLRNPDPQRELDVQRVGMELTEIYLSHEPGLAPEVISFRELIIEWLRACRSGFSGTAGIRVHPLSVSILLQIMYHW
jgi:hypothetical protein